MIARWRVCKPGDVPRLEGLEVRLEVIDGATRSLTIETPSGPVVRIAANQWSHSLEITTPAPPPTVERHRLRGTVRSLAVLELFESRAEAIERRDELSAGLEPSELELELDTVAVPAEP